MVSALVSGLELALELAVELGLVSDAELDSVSDEASDEELELAFPQDELGSMSDEESGAVLLLLEWCNLMRFAKWLVRNASAGGATG